MPRVVWAVAVWCLVWPIAGSASTARADLVACAIEAPGAIALTVDAADPPDVLARTSGGAITFDGVLLSGDCAGSTVDTVESIAVRAAEGAGRDHGVTVALVNGGFVDAAGDEVDIVIALGSGTDTLTIVGTPGADDVRVGTDGINLTGDADADLTGHTTAEILVVDVRGGDDLISGAGGLGTGAAYPNGMRSSGGGGGDTISGGAGPDRIRAGSGDDVVDAGQGADDAAGGEGVDRVRGGTDDDRVDGGAGSDLVDGGPGADDLIGGAGDDLLDGAADDDDEAGQAGNDVFDQGTLANGADDLTGGAGNDAADYSDRQNPVRLDADGTFSRDDGEGGEADEIAADVETLVGGSAADVIAVRGGTAAGRGGPDVLRGLGDDDTLSYAASAAVAVDLADADPSRAGVQQAVSGGDADGDVVSGFENAEGSPQADVLRGSAAPNVLRGGAGDDVLLGRGASDLYDEGATINGSDDLGDDPGTPADEDPGSDTVDYDRRTAPLTVTLGAGADDGEAGENDAVWVENVHGGAGQDLIAGDDAANRIAGGAGGDTLDGGGGIDTLDYRASPGGVRIDLGTGSGSWAHAAGDVVSRFEDVIGTRFGDVIVGDAGRNGLIASRGDDRVSGLEGRDSLVGGSGDDLLDGGGGIDTCSGGLGVDRLRGCER